MKTVSAAPHAAGAYLALRIARHDFALPAACLRGLLPVRELQYIGKPNPALAHYFGPFTCGFARIRGIEFPVVDLRARLGLSHVSHGRQACIVVVEVNSSSGPQLAGFIADRVSDVVQAWERDFSRGKLRLAGRLRDVLMPERVLSLEPVLDRE